MQYILVVKVIFWQFYEYLIVNRSWSLNDLLDVGFKFYLKSSYIVMVCLEVCTAGDKQL